MKKKMIFSSLVGKIASETGVPKELVKELLNETIALNRAGLEEDGHSSLIGLGRFSLKWHKARKGRNPQSGEIIDIPGHNTVNFKAKASLRNHINRRYAQLQPELLEPEKDNPDANIPLSKKKTVEHPQASAAAKKPPPPSRRTRKFVTRWIWLIILFIFIILLYFFWPSSDTSDIPFEEKATIEIVPEKEKPFVETPIRKEAINKTPAKLYSVKKDDYLYSIALDYYKKASFWPLIYKANINQSPNPEIVIPNKEINLPALEGSANMLSNQDKKELAHGYLEVYLYYKDIDKHKAIYYLWVAKQLTADLSGEYANRIDSEDLDIVNTLEGKLIF